MQLYRIVTMFMESCFPKGRLLSLQLLPDYANERPYLTPCQLASVYIGILTYWIDTYIIAIATMLFRSPLWQNLIDQENY